MSYRFLQPLIESWGVLKVIYNATELSNNKHNWNAIKSFIVIRKKNIIDNKRDDKVSLGCELLELVTQMLYILNVISHHV